VVGTPAAEIEIDTTMIRALLEEQHADLAGLPCVLLEAGWDNVMFRLGNALCLRMPRRAMAAPLLENEQAWLPELGNRLPLPVPVPLRIGQPGCGYPWRWSVVRWIAGAAADLNVPRGSEAIRLAEFLKALHVPAPGGVPRNPVRGGPLRDRAQRVEERMERLRRVSTLVSAEVLRVWEDAVSAPIDVAPTWVHGDLHARNVLVEGGAITGVIDWGDVTSGDRAVDLASIWMLFGDREARRMAMDAYGSASDATWRRAKGWAVYIGLILLETGLVDNPRHAVMGERVLRWIAEEP
jgi:aminoglycoside phosphotransferase (APT) family kinase protein